MKTHMILERNAKEHKTMTNTDRKEPMKLNCMICDDIIKVELHEIGEYGYNLCQKCLIKRHEQFEADYPEHKL